MSHKPPHTRTSLRQDLTQLGVTSGDTVMVHASMRSIGAVIGGANTVINALQDVVGAAGTLVAYVDFEPFCDSDDPDQPVFDKRIAHAARDHGVLHEAMRTRPGALRSDHPDAGVVAIGARAEWITSTHVFRYGYGPGTPFEKVMQCNGRVLMLGAPLDTITMLHHAEHLAVIPDKRVVSYRRLMPTPNGATWIDFEEFDTSVAAHASFPDNCFEVIATEYLTTGRGISGRIGNAQSFLFDANDLVQFGIAWMERRVERTGRK